MKARERFDANVQKLHGGCWEWQGTIKEGGYGLVRGADGKNTTAHRFAYEQVHGPVPSHLHVDHLCRNRRCVNPDHLEVVTPAENLRRSPICPGQRTHCPRGHAYTEANTYRAGRRRYCRECRRGGGVSNSH